MGLSSWMNHLPYYNSKSEKDHRCLMYVDLWYETVDDLRVWFDYMDLNMHGNLIMTDRLRVHRIHYFILRGQPAAVPLVSMLYSPSCLLAGHLFQPMVGPILALVCVMKHWDLLMTSPSLFWNAVCPRNDTWSGSQAHLMHCWRQSFTPGI